MREKICGELLCAAASDGNVKVAKLCKEEGADLNYYMYGGKTPLGCAELSEHNEMISLLKEWGATNYGKWSKNPNPKPSSSLSECSQQEHVQDKKKGKCILM